MDEWTGINGIFFFFSNFGGKRRRNSQAKRFKTMVKIGEIEWESSKYMSAVPFKPKVNENIGILENIMWKRKGCDGWRVRRAARESYVTHRQRKWRHTCTHTHAQPNTKAYIYFE